MAFNSVGNENYLGLKRRFSDFILDYQPAHDDRYVDRLEKVLTDGRDARCNARLLVDVHDLQQFDEKLHQGLLKEPCDSVGPFTEAARDAARGLHDGTFGEKHSKRIDTMQLGFVGELGYHKLSPRKVLSSYLNQLICVVGIVTKCSLVHPKMKRSVHYCEATRKFTTRVYHDETDIDDNAPTESNAVPKVDVNGNVLTTEIGLCQFIDNQRVTLQELPEQAPPGQLPRSTEFVLEGDLVDSCKPGDRVMMTGIYRALAGRSVGALSQFRSVVIVNSVERLSAADHAAANVSADDLREMDAIASSPDVLERLGSSLAPSIYGHEWIKRAIVLLLVGGQEKNLNNKTHLRGDINCLLVGDPGVAKSQLLRAVMNVAPLAISTNGRGSTGVGLTAAINTDAETGERRLEAGAVVLADRGLVCVDEFDKMSDVDRVAIHEVMEQQTVTIAKAGVHTSLNARCSIVAAANPLYGSIDESLSLTRNINLPDSLLSRFDLLFVVRDNTNERVDCGIASHVLCQHRYRAPGDDGTLAPAMAEELMEQDEEEGEEPVRFIKANALHGGGPGAARDTVLSVPFLRKYIRHCKTTYAAQSLTQDAFEEISQFYVELRQAAATGVVDARYRPVPVTARTLETMIRLATAHSKIRFSRRIEKADVDVARQLLLRVIDQSRIVGAEDGGEAPADLEDGAARVAARRGTRASRQRGAPAALADSEDDFEHGGGAMDTENAGPQNVAAPEAEAQVGEKRGKSGQRSAAAGEGITVSADAALNLDRATEAKLCTLIDELLVEQRYVDEWSVEGVQRWLQERKSFTISEELLIRYLDRVDQSLPEKLPHVLYDVADKTVHRDY